MEFLRFLESIRTPFFDAVFGFITRFGEETIGLVILCAIFWCINKRVAYGIGIAYFLSGLTVQGMKISFRIDRPWVIDPNFSPVPSAVEHATGYSFPSGHTQSAAALFGSLGFQIKNIPLGTICFLIVFLVAFSRMYLGVHTLLDVSVSLVISLLLIMFTERFLFIRKVNKKRELIIALVMILYAAIAAAIAAALYSRGKIEQGYLSDCLKAAGAGFGYAIGMFIERVYIGFSVTTKNKYFQIIKFIPGLAGVLIIKEGLKLLTGTGLIIDMARYFLMLLWVMTFYPLIIKRFFSFTDKKEKIIEHSR